MKKDTAIKVMAFIGALLFGALTVIVIRKVIMPSPIVTSGITSDETTTEQPASDDLAGGSSGMGGGALPSPANSATDKLQTTAVKIPAGSPMLKPAISGISPVIKSASSLPVATAPISGSNKFATKTVSLSNNTKTLKSIQ